LPYYFLLSLFSVPSQMSFVNLFTFCLHSLVKIKNVLLHGLRTFMYSCLCGFFHVRPEAEFMNVQFR
jgi:hypothetical protein